MTTPLYDLPAALANVPLAQQRLTENLTGLADADLREPSVLPGWSRAHVVAHVALQGEAMVRLIDGVLAGRPAEAYPGGPGARDAAIERSAARSIEDLIDDIFAANVAVVRAFARMNSAAWGQPVEFPTGTFPAARCAWARWREVEVHHVDLGMDIYPPDSWPEEFVAANLPYELGKLAGRLPAGVGVEVNGVEYGTGAKAIGVSGPDPALLAWLLGRVGLAAPDLETTGGPLPELPTWG